MGVKREIGVETRRGIIRWGDEERGMEVRRKKETGGEEGEGIGD